MKAKVNKGFYLFLLSLLLSSHLFAQAAAKHFIQIQIADRQSFYVLYNGMTYRSSDSGIIILSNLKDGTLDFVVSFPKSQVSEQKFSIIGGNTNASYWLKNNQDKGWVLINRSTKAITQAIEKKPNSLQHNSPQPESNAFGKMLSDVVDDPDLTKSNIPTTQVKVDNATKILDKPSQIQSVSITNPTTELIKDSITEANTETEEMPVANTKGVIKESEEEQRDGVAFVFIDFNGFTNDTIRLFIPANDTADSAISAPKANSKLTNQDSFSVQIVKQDTLQNLPVVASELVEKPKIEDNTQSGIVQNPFFANDLQLHITPKAEVTIDTSKTIISSPPVKKIQNDQCGKTLTAEDIYLVKTKMVLQTTEQEMIDIVQNEIKGKCITTEQVKVLGKLFLSDQGRSNFYIGVYEFVYDKSNYPMLESQLTDDSFKNEFKKSIHY